MRVSQLFHSLYALLQDDSQTVDRGSAGRDAHQYRGARIPHGQPAATAAQSASELEELGPEAGPAGS